MPGPLLMLDWGRMSEMDILSVVLQKFREPFQPALWVSSMRTLQVLRVIWQAPS